MGDKPLGPLMIVKEDFFEDVEKMARVKAGDKERERSNRAVGLAGSAYGTRRSCPMRHDTIAWSGPPHDEIRAYVCLRCNAAACEPEIKDMGFDFATCPDWIIMDILDKDLQRQGTTNPSFHPGLGGTF